VPNLYFALTDAKPSKFKKSPTKASSFKCYPVFYLGSVLTMFHSQETTIGYQDENPFGKDKNTPK
jgi:hypothetical protein